MAESSAKGTPRQLRPILEEPDERKSKVSQENDSFSDDESGPEAELPSFQPLPTATAVRSRISFPTSSFGNLIERKQFLHELSTEEPQSAVKVSPTPSMPFVVKSPTKNVTATKKMIPVKSETKPENSDDSLDSPESPDHKVESPSKPQQPSRSFATGGDPWSEIEKDQQKFFIQNFGMPNLATIELRPRESTTVSKPPSLLNGTLHSSPSDKATFDKDALTKARLEDELAEAQEEIAKLVLAIHDKDLKNLEAQDAIRKLADSSNSDKRNSGQLQQMLASALENANTLETKNVHLLTQIDTLSQESQVLVKNLHDIANLFRVRDIPANDQALAYHLKARIENLLETEKELVVVKARLESNQNDVEYFRKESSDTDRILVAAKERLDHVESVHNATTTHLESEVKRLEDALRNTEKKVVSEIDLSHAVAAEARTLSDELRDAQKLIERKDQEIAELQTIVGSNEALANYQRIQKTKSTNDLAESYNDNPRLWELQTENERLKNVMSTLSVNGATKPLTNSFSQNFVERNDDAVVASQSSLPKSQVKREMEILSAALNQVVSASQKAIDHLRTENGRVVDRIHQLEKDAVTHKAELSVLRDQLLSKDAELAIAKNSLDALSKIKQRISTPTEMDWTTMEAVTQKADLSNLSNVLTNIALEKAATLDVLSEQQHQIALLTTALQNLQQNLQPAAQGSRPVSADYVSALSPDVFGQYSKVYDASDSHTDDLSRLQQLLADKEQEVSYWKAIYATNGAVKGDQVDAVPTPDILHFGPSARGHERQIERPVVPLSPRLDEPTKDSMVHQLINENSRLVRIVESLNPKSVVKMQSVQANESTSSARSEPVKNNASSLDNPVDSFSSDNRYARPTGAYQEPSGYSSNSFRDAPLQSGFSRQLSRPELPAVDYESLRRKSRAQLVQFENLCRRIDKANERYASYVTSSKADNLHNADLTEADLLSVG